MKWCSSIEEITPEDWEKIYGSDVIKSREFMKANEVAGFEDVKFHYLEVFGVNGIIAIVPCFSYGMDLLNIATSGKAKGWITKIRKTFPSFLKLQAFVTGSYAATCEHFIEYIPELTDAERYEIANIIGNEIKNFSRQTKSKFIFIKDIRQRDLEHVKGILTSDYKFVISFPTTAIPIIPGVSYPEALRKKNRKRYRKFKERFDQKYYWEFVNDYGGEMTKEFTTLYQSVLQKAKNKFEFLNEKFFESINTLLGKRSFMLIAREAKSKEIRVMVLVLENNHNLIPLYMGFKYKDDDSLVLYLNTIFRTIKESEIRGKSYVDFGQTSYYPKVMSGALVENIYYGFWSGNPIISWFIRHGINKLFNPPDVPDHVYLNDYDVLAHSILTSQGFALLK